MPKKSKQNLKIFYIADYLMKETDGELDINGRPLHGVLVKDIQEYLGEKNIEAEAHAISRDIDLLGGVWKGKDGLIEKFEPILSINGGNGKPIYLDARYISMDDVEMIAECIASSSFLSETDVNDLIDDLKILCSKYQEKRLKSEYIVVERPKYAHKQMISDLATIKEAIKQDRKITFYYTTHSTANIESITRRRKGKKYTVSPFTVALTDGRHYLIGFDGTYHQMKSYRIDRMEEVNAIDGPRDGKEKNDRLGINDYARQTFGMFIGGKADRITIQFENRFLDTMLERFPKGPDTVYKKIDEKHFTVRTFIVESENFYGWICGLGEGVIIIDPSGTAGRFKEYLKKIADRY